jgi:AraC family cel operon transcriptional repressor
MDGMVHYTTQETFHIPELEIDWVSHHSIDRYAEPHDHDFFEFVLIQEGNVIHQINGRREKLAPGDFVWIRPSDQHGYMPVPGRQIIFLNISITRSFCESAARLAGGFSVKDLEAAPDPPSTHLDKESRYRLLWEFDCIDDIRRTPEFGPKSRALIASIMSDYFVPLRYVPRIEIPAWLDELCSRMEAPENFVCGLDRLNEISGYSPEHIARSFRKHLGMSPTQFVNSLRLGYAEKLLFSTDLSVAEIALHSGFGNLSHFHHLFKERYGIGPRTWKKSRR